MVIVSDTMGVSEGLAKGVLTLIACLDICIHTLLQVSSDKLSDTLIYENIQWW
jgi:hypothetical protein